MWQFTVSFVLLFASKHPIANWPRHHVIYPINVMWHCHKWHCHKWAATVRTSCCLCKMGDHPSSPLSLTFTETTSAALSIQLMASISPSEPPIVSHLHWGHLCCPEHTIDGIHQPPWATHCLSPSLRPPLLPWAYSWWRPSAPLSHPLSLTFTEATSSALNIQSMPSISPSEPPIVSHLHWGHLCCSEHTIDGVHQPLWATHCLSPSLRPPLLPWAYSWWHPSAPLSHPLSLTFTEATSSALNIQSMPSISPSEPPIVSHLHWGHLCCSEHTIDGVHQPLWATHCLSPSLRPPLQP